MIRTLSVRGKRRVVLRCEGCGSQWHWAEAIERESQWRNRHGRRCRQAQPRLPVDNGRQLDLF